MSKLQEIKDARAGYGVYSEETRLEDHAIEYFDYLLQLVETQAEQMHISEMAMRKAVAIWETATPEDDFDDVMHAVIDELKGYLIAQHDSEALKEISQ